MNFPWIIQLRNPAGNGPLTNADVGGEPIISVALTANSNIVYSNQTTQHISTGVYVFNQPSWIEGVSYTANWDATVAGVPQSGSNLVQIGPPPSANGYINYNRFIRKYGVKNVTYVSNQNNPNSLVPDLDVVNDAFLVADAEVNNNLRGGPYVVPLTFTTYAGVVDYSVQEAAMTVAYGYMYFSRWDNSLSLDENEAAQRSQTSKLISTRISQVYTWFSLVQAGIKRISADYRTDGSYNLTPKTVGLYELEVARFTNWWKYGQIC
jgi:hypothetical protein